MLLMCSLFHFRSIISGGYSFTPWRAECAVFTDWECDRNVQNRPKYQRDGRIVLFQYHMLSIDTPEYSHLSAILLSTK